MSIETNKLTMHCFTEFINTASEKLARELISPRNLPCSGTLRGDAGALLAISLSLGSCEGASRTSNGH